MGGLEGPWRGDGLPDLIPQGSVGEGWPGSGTLTHLFWGPGGLARVQRRGSAGAELGKSQLGSREGRSDANSVRGFSRCN